MGRGSCRSKPATPYATSRFRATLRGRPSGARLPKPTSTSIHLCCGSRPLPTTQTRTNAQHTWSFRVDILRFAWQEWQVSPPEVRSTGLMGVGSWKLCVSGLLACCCPDYCGAKAKHPTASKVQKRSGAGGRAASSWGCDAMRCDATMRGVFPTIFARKSELL
jgi:hypothetical protein